tara:strand:- start:2122 stop:2562 length:441 start_codon:yes stop_codon:yes gene_type:complete
MSIFRHLPDDIIEIDGEKFDLELFLELEPEYSIPEGFVSREYGGNKHIIFSKDNQVAGEIPWKDGERYLTRVPDLHLLQKTNEEDLKYVESFKTEPTKPLTRIDEYPHISELIVAMWEHFVEGRPAEKTINIVQEKRLKVKEKYSK